MKPCLIANPNAAAGRVGRNWTAYARMVAERFGPCDVKLTERRGDATLHARDAARRGARHVVVVGGDGTLNEAVNGLFASDGDTPINPDLVLAYVPAGTGTDYARSVGLSGRTLSSLFSDCTERRVDIGRATLRGPDGAKQVRHFVNVSSFGASGLIADLTNRSSKRFGGKISFYMSTLRGLLAWRNRPIRLRIDDTFDQEVTVNTVAVANGRYFGGGMKIAPDALLDDGALDVIIVGNIRVTTFLSQSPRLYAGTHLALPYVTALRGRRVAAEPLDENPIPIETDGEHPGHLSVEYSALPGAMTVLAHWSKAEAVAEV